MNQPPQHRSLPPLFAAFLALVVLALTSGCAAYTAANDENPGARSLGGGRSHGTDTGHTH